MGPRTGSSNGISLLILCLLLTLVTGHTTVSPQQAVATNKQQSVRLNNSSDLSESADSSGHPSITSVHQVWTSTSSGRLDELSPEVIGKLRNDVPFLAAYALRPRLVGAITSQPSGAIQPLESYISSQIQQPPSSKLGDFSELNVETSSLSKSEHHHKRKTSLKRQKAFDGSSNKDLKLKRRVLETTSRLLKGNKGGSKTSKTKALRPMARVGRLKRKLDRRNLQHHMNIIRHGRHQQPASDNKGDDGVKGGGEDKKKTPFYSRSGSKQTSKDDEHEGVNQDDAGLQNDQEDEDVDISKIEGDGDLEQPQLKRVGDGDVDEVEGDTVTVMPKFDGVDDDPELPDSLPAGDTTTGEAGDEETTNDSNSPELEGNGRGRRVNRERPDESAGDGGQVLGGGIGATTGSGGPPTVSSGSEDEDKSVEGSSSKEKNSSNVKPGVEFAANDKDGSDGSSAGSSKTDEQNVNDSTEDEDAPGGQDNLASGGESRKPSDIERKKSRGEESASTEPDDEVNRDSKSRAKTRMDGEDLDYRDDDVGNKDGAGKRHKASEGGRMKAASDEHENRSHRKDCKDDGSYSHHDDHHHHHDHHHNSIKWLEDAVAGKPGYDYPILSRANATNFNCHDQKYPGYYADVEARCQVFHICQADGRQDSFLCPNGTIFSQKTTVCVWWSSFDCEDAPKYYDLNALLYKTAPQSTMAKDGAAVTSDLKPRDQQPELRSRKEDSKQDEDENEESSIDGLIRAMKRRNPDGGNGIEIMRMVPDGGKRTGTGASTETDEGGADDVLQPKTNPNGSMDMIGPYDDEASIIQRKTPASAIEAADEQEEGDVGSSKRLDSSRFRSPSKSKAKARKRRRRASVRQSPPKLTSRRYSRVSRRWKLRHTPKPKRRA